jgi:hypothetical protein
MEVSARRGSDVANARHWEATTASSSRQGGRRGEGCGARRRYIVPRQNAGLGPREGVAIEQLPVHAGICTQSPLWPTGVPSGLK